MAAPYDPFPWLTELAVLFEKLSPAINAWIQSNIPAHLQAELTHRIRRCKRYCRRNKLNAALIASQVNLMFVDLTEAQRTQITSLLDFELNQK